MRRSSVARDESEEALAPGTLLRAASGERSTRRAWFRLLLWLAAVVVALCAVVVGSRALPAASRVPYDERTEQRLRKAHPSVVLLGNSMVDSRFDEQALKSALGTKRVAVVGVPGSKSAHWYLMLKNQILPAKPKRVLLFFYGEELTTPTARALGGQVWRAQVVSREDDPVVTAKLAPTWEHEPIRRIYWHVAQLAPIERLRALTDDRVRGWANEVSAWLQAEPDDGARSAMINRLFELDNLRRDNRPEQELAQSEPEAEAWPFAELIERSFLPDILALTREAGVQLVILNIRLRKVAEGESLTPAERVYLQQLEQYLTAHHVRFVDMNPNEWEALSFYGENTHLKRGARRKYTRLFVQHMAYLFE